MSERPRPAAGAPTLILACGALAREVTALVRANGWTQVTVSCLPAALHNRPERIPAAVRDRLRAAAGTYERVLVAYADCGTGGALDRVLAEEDAQRMPGAHCYELFAGPGTFAALAEAEPGTFYLTDFLVRHFDRLVLDGLGITAHPELEPIYFAHYRRVVFLSQTADDGLLERARGIGQRLGLLFEHVHTGYGGLASSLAAVVPAPRSRALADGLAS